MQQMKALTVLFLLTLQGCGGSGDSAVLEPPVLPPESTVVTTETLARFDIYALSGEIQDEPKIAAKMKVTQYIIGQEPIINYEGEIGVEYRGSSSQYYYDKKNFGIETRDAAQEGISVELLDFPAEEDWVLHGPYGDKSLMRNALMFQLAKSFGHYSSRWQYVEVYVENDYQGLYVFMEKIKRDDNRVNINKLKEDENEGEDLTGGYIIKLDKTNGEHEGNPGAYDLYTDDMSFISKHGSKINSISSHHFIYHTPKSTQITEQQKNYIQNYVHAFEDALAGNDFRDEQLGYRNYINVDTFVDYFLATELSGNVDGYRLSTYMYKDKNSKLSMGPLWDYNLAFGNADYCEGWSNTVWVYRSEERCAGGVFGVPFWWYQLLADDDFKQRVKSRWLTLRASELSNTKIEQYISTMQNTLLNTDAVTRNFVKWPILGTYVWPNYYVGSRYNEEVDYLKSWLTTRLKWLDTEIANL
jgi:hypothetical protein